MKLCKLCGKETVKNRYICMACFTKVRRIRCKTAAVEYLGGKCERCGWTGNIAAFEFHHKDPSQKEFTIGNVSNKRWEVVKVELIKCELLCSNCHRIEHTNRDEALYQVVREYKGQILK